MAIPVYLQQFKAAGIYRVVFDKSTVAGVDSEILRLVVGYSEKGPFNIPTYVKSVSDFKAIYGDISKKLEKRGVYFHRLALQCLESGPILALNLKKFDGEKVGAATISSAFVKTAGILPISETQLNVKDIFDTTRFWELNAEKLNNVLDRYINISAINTKETSCSLFIRKASGSKVSAYNITLNDWYADEGGIPEGFENYANNLVSDFFAEIYVFKGKFEASQVLASTTLKNYFEVNADGQLVVKHHVTDAYGNVTDGLDALFNDELSNAVGHYVGSLIPNFKNKLGQYQSLDILFNLDEETHNLMMAFNVDQLDNGTATIDLSGRHILTSSDIDKIFAGSTVSHKTSLLGNIDAPIVADVITFGNNVLDADGNPVVEFNDDNKTRVVGTMFVSKVNSGSNSNEGSYYDDNFVTLTQVGTANTNSVTIHFKNKTMLAKAAKDLGVEFDANNNPVVGKGTYNNVPANVKEDPDTHKFVGVEKLITSVSRIDGVMVDGSKKDVDAVLSVNFLTVGVVANSKIINASINPVYGSSLSFIKVAADFSTDGTILYDEQAASILSEGDCILGVDTEDDDDTNLNPIYVQSIEGNKIKFTDTVFIKSVGSTDMYIVRFDAPINQEIGTVAPVYLEGYTYLHSKPEGTTMDKKYQWRNDWVLSVLSEEVGIRTALLDKANIDYRYVVDTFESYVEAGLKNQLSLLCKEKQSAFAICNFPAVKTFIKCNYSSFTDANGVFKVQYVVDGLNKKKAGSVKFSLPTEFDGASFAAFYTPLKFSDGYVDTMVPSAGLVSNLFIQKYASRQPYYIVAGPNYAKITYTDLVGPDYTYSKDELQIIEPFGVNCMVYRPGFGTFINANQTAKQTPVSALSRVNVRELVIYIQDEIEKVLQAYQWEFNNPITRNAILTRANGICANVAANGGIQAYLNVMDKSNNTPDIIDNEMAVLSTHIEPGIGCGKMVQELTLYRTGQMKASITEA